MKIQIQTTPGGSQFICDEFEPCPNGFRSDIFERVPCVNFPMDYQTRTADELLITDLKRENNAAFELIQRLSNAFVALGYDPTQV